jgi:hypothetical protein
MKRPSKRERLRRQRISAQAQTMAATREAGRREMTRRALYGPDYAAMTEAEAEMEWRLRREAFSEELRRGGEAGR